MNEHVTCTNQKNCTRLQGLSFVSVAAFLASTLSATFAHAGGMEEAVGEIYDQATAVTESLGLIALIVVGIGAMFGRISVTQALVVAVGIAIAADPDWIYGLIQ